MNFGKVIRQKWVNRSDLHDNPTTLFAFGDNMARVGMGGQAGAMRGELNAVGIPTKNAPGMGNTDFFNDGQFDTVIPELEHEFQRLRLHLKSGLDVVIPFDGLGTGLSELPSRAPKINAGLNLMIAKLELAASEIVVR